MRDMLFFLAGMVVCTLITGVVTIGMLELERYWLAQ